MKYCRNCRYIRKTKEMWCKCTGYSVKPNDTCDKWEKLMKKCDICGKEQALLEGVRQNNDLDND